MFRYTATSLPFMESRWLPSLDGCFSNANCAESILQELPQINRLEYQPGNPLKEIEDNGV